MRRESLFAGLVVFVALAGIVSAQPQPPVPARTIVVDVVALDQPLILNRLGAAQNVGMIYALKRDVVSSDGTDDLKPGKVRLRDGKRPRPLVLRCNVGDTLKINFTNLLKPADPNDVSSAADQDPATRVPITRNAGLHINGLNLVGSIASDASWVGANASSYASPGKTKTYTYVAEEEGTFLLYSQAGDQVHNGTSNGTLNAGLFGACHVEPRGAEYYRSQVTRQDMHLAAYAVDASGDVVDGSGKAGAALRWKARDAHHGEVTLYDPILKTVVTNYEAQIKDGRLYADTGHPILNWQAQYLKGTAPGVDREAAEGLPVPILNMLRPRPKLGAQHYELVHTDLTAIITGPDAGRFPYYLKSPSFHVNSAYPDRRQPYREFTIIYHDFGGNKQAFPIFTSPDGAILSALSTGRDSFPINYGTGGIGAEILANRLGLGPEGNADAVDLKYEEFFLSSWAVGDPAMITDTAQKSGSPTVVQSVLIASVPTEGLIDAQKELDWISALRAAGVPQDAKKTDENARTFRESKPTPILGNLKTIRRGTDWAVLAEIGDRGTFNAERNRSFSFKVRGNSLEIREVPTSSASEAIDATSEEMHLVPSRVLYPDDPSNVYHSYLRDHCKFRILNAGPSQNHVHHLHAHQWLHTPNSDTSHYLDSQMIMPGATFTLEMVYNGSGNRNQTVGDSIFHCHFYPHFAQGMWSLWRVHDVFESGTLLENGKPKAGWNRALPDGELPTGTPIPAVVPLPTLGMAPMPAKVKLNDMAEAIGTNHDDTPAVLNPGRRVAEIEPVRRTNPDGTTTEMKNPGFPFWVPGVAGHRAPHPPLDFAWLESDGNPVNENGDTVDWDNRVLLDGGLPRHVVLNGKIFKELHTRWDFTKDFVLYSKDDELLDGYLVAMNLPEEGTEWERHAMDYHATRSHATLQPDGQAGNFICNGLPAVPGAPYADPSVDDDGNESFNRRRYQAAVIQMDVVLNKRGWHYPQQRFITLWDDVAPTVAGARAPEPFFFRSNTGDSIEYWHTNLVPNYYEMDDFQVRTPTDVIGQHIHLVKFDVTSSDGGGNGFNYEDGTFGPDEVRERIFSINKAGGLHEFDPTTQFFSPDKLPLKVKKAEDYYDFGTPPAGQDWNGAQTTVQRWDADPLINQKGDDRTLRTVFTHDHFGPSTHQQVGLYAGLVIEPEGSEWLTSAPSFAYDKQSAEKCSSEDLLCRTQALSVAVPAGTKMYTRPDGGPTSWQAVIQTPDSSLSYREFLLEFQDLQLAYTARSTAKLQLPPPGSDMYFDDAKATMDTRGAIVKALEALTAGAGTPTDYANVESVFANAGVVLPAEKKYVKFEPAPGFGSSPDNNRDVYTWIVTSEGDGGIASQSPDAFDVSARWTMDGSVSPPVHQTASPQSIGIKPDPLTAHETWADPLQAINPPNANVAPYRAPYPQLVSGGVLGTYSMNYRNEPLPLRIAKWEVTAPNQHGVRDNVARTGGPDRTLEPNQDPANYYASIERQDPNLNRQPFGYVKLIGDDYRNPPESRNVDKYLFPPPLNWVSEERFGLHGTDPYTPLMQAYQNDKVQIRTLVGAHTVLHSFQLHGFNFLFEPAYADSGYRSVQGMGLSEHFEMLFDVPTTSTDADYLYQASSGTTGQTNGLWGMLRAYAGKVDETKLKTLPGNRDGQAKEHTLQPPDSLPAPIQVVAVTAQQALPEQLWKGAKLTPSPRAKQYVPGGFLFRNARGQNLKLASAMPNYPLVDPNALLYVLAEDLDSQGKINSGLIPEPLVLRARAGDWIVVELENRLPAAAPNQPGQVFANQPAGNPFGLDPLKISLPTSRRVGLHAELLAFDVTQSNGVRVGLNPDNTTAAPGRKVTYTWFAGAHDGTPIEFGTVPLQATEPLVHHQKGLIGAIVIEPAASSWKNDLAAGGGSRTSATVTPDEGELFREFVVFVQNDIQPALALDINAQNQFSVVRQDLDKNKSPLEVSFNSGVNYRSEPVGYRYPGPIGSPLGGVPQSGQGYSDRYSDSLVGNQPPQTPTFTAKAGTPVRFRVVFAGGTAVNSQVFIVNGHGWQELPWEDGGTRLGNNTLSQAFGSQEHVPNQPMNLLIPSAGGPNKVAGDYFFGWVRNQPGDAWGILRVTE